MTANRVRMWLCFAMAAAMLTLAYYSAQPKDIAIPYDSVCDGQVYYA